MVSNRPSLRALLLNPAFVRSYWNMEFLCELDGFKSLAPPLGLLTVAALLPQEWQFRLVDESTQPLTGDDWDWADVVLLSAMIVQHARLKELVREAKARGKTVVVGGSYPSVMPEEVLATGADIVVKGEFENLAAPLLQALEAGKSGILLEAPHKPDMTLSPVPRFDLLRPADYGVLSIQTSRGCPFDCEFCDVVTLFGRKVRQKTPEQVLAELEAIYRLGWRKEVFITDDNFIGNKSYARKLLHRMIPWLKSRGEPFIFWTQVSVNLGQDLELIDLMTEANFANIFVGVESPDEEVLRLTHKHQNIQHPLVESVNALTANGLTVMASFILGLDQEVSGTGQRIAAFVEATNIPNVMLNLLVPLPKTRLWKRLAREGRLREEVVLEADWQDISLIGPLAYKPTRPEAEILSEHLFLWDHLFDRSQYLARAYRYYLAMRPTRAALARGRGEATPPTPRGTPFSLRDELKKWYTFLRLSWRQGVKPPSRWQYWIQLYKIFRRNPSRMIRYLKTCAMGEDMFLLREVVRQRLMPGRH